MSRLTYRWSLRVALVMALATLVDHEVPQPGKAWLSWSLGPAPALADDDGDDGGDDDGGDDGGGDDGGGDDGGDDDGGDDDGGDDGGGDDDDSDGGGDDDDSDGGGADDGSDDDDRADKGPAAGRGAGRDDGDRGRGGGETADVAGLIDAVRGLLGLARPFAPLDDGGESRPREIVAGEVSAAELQRLIDAGYAPVEIAEAGTLGLRPARLRVPATASLAAARAEVAAITNSEVVDRNHLYRPQAACVGEACAPRELVGWPDTRGEGRRCGAGAVVGLVDTSVNTNHTVFRDQDVEVVDSGRRGSRSDARHGTAVAALLVGAPASRVPGLVPAARLVAVDPFAAEASGDATDAFELALALDRLVARGVDVVNLSLAGPANRLVEQAVRAAERRGVVLVAAAGNAGPAAPPAFPGAYREVVAVTAVDRELRPYRRAQRGAHVELAAPGVDVPTAASIRGVRPKTGTSFAAPFVTAAAAALGASQPAAGPDAIRASLRERAQDLGDAGVDDIFGHGLLQADDPCPARIAEPS